TTGVALIVGVIVLVGTVTGVNLVTSASKPTVSNNMTMDGTDIFGRGNVDVRSRVSYPTAVLPPGFAANVTAVDVKEMDRVIAGSVLIRLDDRQAKAKLAEARAALDLAKIGIATAKDQVREHSTKVAQQKRLIRTAELTWEKANEHWKALKKADNALG